MQKHTRVLLSDTVDSVEQMFDLLPVTDRKQILVELFNRATQEDRVVLVAASTVMYFKLRGLLFSKRVDHVEIARQSRDMQQHESWFSR